LPFEVELDHRDFVEAMMRRPEHADAAWCSLSIHHLSTDDKLRLMKAIRGATGARGIFLLYEPPAEWDQIRPSAAIALLPQISPADLATLTLAPSYIPANHTKCPSGK
jgi:hypothetical protein